MLGSDNEDKKAAIADLSNLASMYAKDDVDSGGIMGVPKGDNIDAGSWWSWLTGTTSQKSDEYKVRAQEDLQGMDFSGAPAGYQSSMEEDLAKLLRMRGEANPLVQTSVEQPMVSDDLAARESLPTEELNDDEYFLRTGELREPLSPAPVEDDRPSTGLMSPDQSAIEQAVEEAMSQGDPTERLDTKGESPVDSTTIMASVRDKDVTTNSAVDMNKVESLILDTVGRNKYSAGILGVIKTEVGEGVKDESPYYSLQGAYDVWTDSDVDDALNNLPVEQASRLRADQTAGVRTGGQASKADRKALGEAMFDKKYDGGKKYKGRGLIQITHKSNYKEVGKRLGLDLVANPELVNDPKYAVPAALAYLDYKGYFKLKDSEITKNKLQALVNPNAPTKTKNERWSFTEAYLKDIKDEGGAVETSIRPEARK